MTDTSLIGDNRPPQDLLLGDALAERLKDSYPDLIKRAAELLEAEGRVPDITTEDLNRKAADFVSMLGACRKAANAAREKEKAPYLAGSRQVDGWFNGLLIDLLDDAKGRVERKMTDFMRQKAAEERARRQEEERLKREAEAEARRQAEEAAKRIADDRSLQDAIAAEKAANQAAADAEAATKAATAKPADLSRSRGEYGAVASLRRDWVFSDLDRSTLDLEMLRHHIPSAALEQAVRSFIKAGGRTLVGVRIYETETTVVR